MSLEKDHCQAVSCRERPQHRVRFDTPSRDNNELELCVVHTFLVFDAASYDGVVEVIAP